MPACNEIGIQRKLNSFYLSEIGAPERFGDAPARHEYATIHRIEDEWNHYEEA
jgi:hypothetical protein